MGAPQTTKAPYNMRGLCLMSAGTTHLDPQGWALRAVHNHNPHGKLLVPELGVGCRNGTTVGHDRASSLWVAQELDVPRQFAGAHHQCAFGRSQDKC
jgi:hypothetical protein